ncbi:hypothetical protein [Novosphingobium sp.]|uniref:hypothetical protein n=1 Tax=Novosphingobium sp. TaxID=1874826 RepID=UPI00273662AB|nr:hypothetical protein [Novosphingobium sp.]MDP3905664.1 hypothetical protein [Novosphingobium sp.]
MKTNWISAVIGMTAFAASTLSAPALAETAKAAQVELESDVKVEKVVAENGTVRKTWVTPQVVVPGDRLIFSVRYRNVSADKVETFVVTNPIPQPVMLAADGADALDVSVDAGRNWGSLGALQVADGKGGQRGALNSDVTHIRWTLPVLNPGESGTLTYNAIVR